MAINTDTIVENLWVARSKELYDWEPELLELIDALTVCQKCDRRIVSAALAIWIIVSMTGCGLCVEGIIRFVWNL